MEEPRIPDFAKSRDILLFNYSKSDDSFLDELYLNRPIGRDERLVKFLHYISTGNRIRYNRFDKEKGGYDGCEDTNFSTLYDRFMKGELDLVHPLNDIIYVFGKIAKMCNERGRGIEHVIKSGRVSYKMAEKKGGKEFPPMIYGKLDGRHDAYINVLVDGAHNSTFEFDLEFICDLIRIKYPPDKERRTPVTRKFSKFLKRYMQTKLPKKIKLFDGVFKCMLGTWDDDSLKLLMNATGDAVKHVIDDGAVYECERLLDHNEN